MAERKTIYLDDAIEAIHKRIAVLQRDPVFQRKHGDIDLYGVIPLLQELQPAEQWTLCNKRMPDEREWLGTKQFGTTISDEVYVTFENPKGERFAKHLSFQNGKLSDYDQHTIDAFYKGSKPIAWRPLPEPYKGE